MNRILIVGYGDIGHRVAQLWLAQGAEVIGLARHFPDNPDKLKFMQADLDLATNLTELPTKQAIIYYFAPPPAEGDSDSRLENFLNAIEANALPKRIIYISTSGVYGDCQGGFVDESSPCQPITDRARRRLAAEQALTTWTEQHNVASVILRVGGIYGPGRLPLEKLKQGMKILRRDLAPYTNRIHADDLALVCQAAVNTPLQHRIYNVCDNQPSTMSDYFIAVAKHAGLPPPIELDWQQAEQELSPAMLSYLHESRRMNNNKLLQELGIKLKYPDLESGLENCFA